jgi:hypothetical protein
MSRSNSSVTGIEAMTRSAARGLTEQRSRRGNPNGHSTPVGTWHPVVNKRRLELSIHFLNTQYSGTIRDEGGATELMEQIS